MEVGAGYRFKPTRDTNSTAIPVGKRMAEQQARWGLERPHVHRDEAAHDLLKEPLPSVTVESYGWS